MHQTRYDIHCSITKHRENDVAEAYIIIDLGIFSTFCVICASNFLTLLVLQKQSHTHQLDALTCTHCRQSNAAKTYVRYLSSPPIIGIGTPFFTGRADVARPVTLPQDRTPSTSSVSPLNLN
uniref:Uncharacterized protein n=1 Tax=Kalanchoe fedtschenkoi TaxID=63787 RepID=A0A7N0ULP7_KALFE